MLEFSLILGLDWSQSLIRIKMIQIHNTGPVVLQVLPFCFQDPDAFWDFISLVPESTHQVSILFSDRGTPDGFRLVS